MYNYTMKLTRKQKKRGRIEFGRKLNENLPKSEQWFQRLYKSFQDSHDQYNMTWAGYIPDVINKKYKYIIEIDGSIHDREDIKAKDKLKEELYWKSGYAVIRIVAYDIESFKEGLTRILRKRNYPATKIVIYDQGKEILNFQFTPKVYKTVNGKVVKEDDNKDKVPIKYILRKSNN